jgi:hypothetical protein
VHFAGRVVRSGEDARPRFEDHCDRPLAVTTTHRRSSVEVTEVQSVKYLKDVPEQIRVASIVLCPRVWAAIVLVAGTAAIVYVIADAEVPTGHQVVSVLLSVAPNRSTPAAVSPFGGS